LCFNSIPRELFSDKAFLRPRLMTHLLRNRLLISAGCSRIGPDVERANRVRRSGEKRILPEMVLAAAAFLLLFCAANAQNNVRFSLFQILGFISINLQIDASDLCPLKIQLWQQILQNGQNQ
jgi:hypothetical protein